MELFKKLKEEDDVRDLLEREFNSGVGDRIALKNDIVTILIADKTLD